MKILAMFLILFVLQSQDGFAQSKTCLLGFVKATSREAQAIAELQKDLQLDGRAQDAQPRDIVTCAQGNYRQIVIVAHSGLAPQDSSQALLVYFNALTPDARRQFLQNLSQKLLERIHGLESQGVRLPDPKRSPKNGDAAPSIQSLDLARSYKNLKRLRELPENFPVYDAPKPFFPFFWENLYQTLKEAKSQGSRLEEITFANCHTTEVKKAYPALVKIERELGIKIKFMPSSGVWSTLKGEEVTQLTYGSLKKLIRFE